MMKKSWKNRSGVSPVIATILMVAITVVLAAVLYVMVMGFGGNSGSTPSASLTKNASTGHIVIGISSATSNASMKFSVGSTVSTTLDQASSGHITANGVTVTFIDVGGDGKVTAGDYFTVSGTATGSPSLSLLYVSSGTTTSIATYAL